MFWEFNAPRSTNVWWQLALHLAWQRPCLPSYPPKFTSRKLPGQAYLRYACFGSSMHPDRTVSGRSTSPTSPFLRAANAPPGPPRPMTRFKWDMGLRGVPVSRFLLHPDVLQRMPVRCASLQSVCRYVSNVIGAGDGVRPSGCFPIRFVPSSCSCAPSPLLLGAGTV